MGPTGKISKLFANDQPWVKVRKRLHFVDENDSAAFLQDPVLLDDFSYEEGLKSKKKTSIESQKPVQTSQPSSSPLSTTAQQPANTRNSSNSRYNLRHHKTRALSGVSLHEYHHHEPVQPAGLDVGGPEDNGAAVRSISEHLLYSSPGFGDNTSPGLTSDGSPFNVTYSPLSNRVSGLVTNIKLDSSQWCFHDAQEAMLFRYFAQKLAPLFDMCDDERHFAQIVPRRAIFCPPLMNAMLAASAKHLSRVSDFDGLVVEQYHQKCLNVLIPALSSSTAVMDENLLPAVVILRYMEELDVPISTSTLESHLLGTRVFVAAQEELCGYTGLWRAAFWLALRQEIYLAFIQARPVHSSFVLENAEQLIQQDDSGCNYANLMILHCAACMRYCYGSELQDVATWEKLKTRLDALWEERPWMFSPMYEEDGETDVFPVRQYLNDAVVMGVQHHLLAEIIMAAHNPKIPRLGPGQLTATRETDRAIKYNVRLLCGIAEVSNRRSLKAVVGSLTHLNLQSNSCTVPSYVFVFLSLSFPIRNNADC